MSTKETGPAPRTAEGPPGPVTAAARERLDALEGAPLEQQVRAYDELHRDLTAALADPGHAEGPPRPGAPRPGA